MNKEKVYLKGYVIGHAADTLGYQGLMVQLENLDIVEVDKNLVHKQLDEPQKPVVPQFVADWINYCKNTFLSIARSLMVEEIDFYNYANQEGRSRLIEFLGSMINQDRFTRAWLDGYTVEKEKRYLVKIIGVGKLYECLNFDVTNKKWIFFDCDNTDKYRTHHTRKELEEAGFGWVFDCEGIEIEEVEE